MSGRFSLPFLSQRPDAMAAFVPIAPVIPADFEAPEQSIPTTLVVWGRDDRLMPRERADELAARIPGAETALIDDAGHACYLDQPDAFHDLLLELLGSL